MLFAAAGYKVRIYDIEPKQITDALSNICSQLEHLEEIGLMRGHLTKEQQFQAIEGTNDLKYCIEGAIYIQVNRYMYYIEKAKCIHVTGIYSFFSSHCSMLNFQYKNYHRLSSHIFHEH